ncbi:hypothetical protein PIB30_108998 [Stylosanthes scabra]|uniref:CCHC-type domain-containing protein n=1 Tax=Stylosanthes scabra TaxID=79078 RepID=A0ABU6R180_9FABA|nr:hypothetical protein [Stylosanthes scabra]
MKQFNKFAKKKNFNFKGKKKAPPKCFECGEVGHIKPNCPKLQREEKDKKMKKKKQKAYMSWENEDDSSTDSDEENEVANLCLMANLEKASNENEDLKKTNDELQKENESLKVQNKTFEMAEAISNNESCESCKKHIHEIERLNTCLSKFNESSKNLDNMLKNQKHVHDKKGIGYNINKASSSKDKKVKRTIRQPQANKANKVRHQPNRQPPKHALHVNHNHNAYRQPFRQPFSKMPRMHNPHVTCHYCNKIGDIAPVCFTKIKHMQFRNEGMRWVPYGRFAHANPQGPKFMWVPKKKF